MKPGFARNLALRVGTAAVALPAVVAVLFLAPPWATVALLAVMAGLGLVEYLSLLRARELRPPVAGAALLTAVGFASTLDPRLAVLWPAAAVLLLLPTLWRPAAERDAVVGGAAGAALGAVYVGVPTGTIAALRLLPPAGEGAWWVVLLLACVMSADTFAYFVGSAVGRHKLAPAISPGKTVEGTVGGLLGGMLGALVVRALGLPALSLSRVLLLGLAVAALGTAGDLVESLLKRWAGVKDSGTLFPGHGGVLDRLDSLLFGAPVLYYYLGSAR